MKLPILTLALVGAPALWALGPEDIANKTIRISMSDALIARSDINQAPEAPWYWLDEVTDFVIDFPETATFTTTAEYFLKSNVQVSYTPDAEQNKAYVKLESTDFCVQVELTYTSNSEGTATIAWHQAGDTRHIRNIHFTVQNDFDVAARVELPEEIISTSPEGLNDGLQDIINSIETANYRTATDKLYQKRLVSLLPIVMVLQDASWTSPDYKGNTALHYACGLSHVELVRWLIEHGADLESFTDKGASIDACISGKNAKQIKAMLAEARAWRDTPYQGPEIDSVTAREAAAWLEVEFSGIDLENPAHDVLIDEQKAEQCARLIYRYIKSGNGLASLGVSVTDTTGKHLIRVRNAKVSEDMFVEWILRDLKQIRRCKQVAWRGAGMTLARLPHMILSREDEGMTTDGATAVYRAACEGNVELLQWLIDHGADRRLLNEQGSPTTLPANTPNLQQVQSILGIKNNFTDSPQSVAGKTFTFTSPDFDTPITITWEKSNAEQNGTVKQNEDWNIVEVTYTKTGTYTATVKRDSQWAPGGEYASDWSLYIFELQFTSQSGGTATCTKETKYTEQTQHTGTFSLK